MEKKFVAIIAAVIVVVGGIWFLLKSDAQTKFLEKHEAGAQIEFDHSKNYTELRTLMKNEHDLYNKIIENGKEDASLVKDTIKEAKNTIKKSEVLIENTKDTLAESYKVTGKSFPFAKKIRDEKLKKQALEMTSLYKKRYELFQDMIQSYEKVIKLEYTLYDKLDSKKHTIKEIHASIAKLEKEYKDVNALEEEINKCTKKYNKVKQEFYKGMSI